jgi:predicted glycoside hydrolase/deacetylase ChbG (UPF0249 family)
MPIPPNIIANADDLGLNQSVNRSILHCFEQGYINSTSLLTNTVYFEETVNMIHENPSMHNIGVHVNLAEFKPVTNFDQHFFLDENGNWDFGKVNKKLKFIDKQAREAFSKEIFAQVDKVLANHIPITHLDSHCHIHTLPFFFNLFVKAAKYYKLKLRLAQTYYEGSSVNFLYRQFINNLVKLNGNNYSDLVETMDYFLKNGKNTPINKSIEIVLHPDFDSSGRLTDHYDNMSVTEWIEYFTNYHQLGDHR